MDAARSGRVRRSESEWRALLEQWRSSGQGLREFCREQQIQISSFQRWRARLASTPVAGEFVSVTPAQTPASPIPWSFELVLPNGCMLRFQG